MFTTIKSFKFHFFFKCTYFNSPCFYWIKSIWNEYCKCKWLKYSEIWRNVKYGERMLEQHFHMQKKKKKKFICRSIFDLSVNSFIEMLCVAQIRFWKEKLAFSIFIQHLFQAWSNLRLNVFFRGTTAAVHWANLWDLNLQTFSSPNLTPLLHHPNLSLKH